MIDFAINLARRIAPLKLKKLFLLFVNPYREKKYAKKLRDSPFKLPDKGIHLSMAGVIPREDGALIQGGRVKLTALDKLFPENLGSFNILYLVSSALPKHSVEYVKWAKENGVKIVWNQNGVGYPAWAGESYEEINRPMKSIIHLADFVFYQSRFCKQSADRYLGEISKPWDIAYNYVDTDQFIPSNNRREGDVWRLLSAGSHLKSYRAISVFETVAELVNRGHKVELTMAGPMTWEGAEIEIERVINKLDIKQNVKFINSFTRTKAPFIFQSSHILLHTKYKDPCPTIPIEAMSCGVPVVGSGNGGMPELVSQSAGILIDIKNDWERIYTPDPLQMADAVENVMDNYEQYSKGARNHAVENFGEAKWLANHRQVFSKLINHKN